MTGTRGRDLAGRAVDQEVDHRDELPRRDLPDDDVVRRLEEVAGLRVFPRQRAKDELRHRHVRRRLDPVARHVSEHRREPAVVELDEVVDVAADLDARRRLVRITQLEPAQPRQRPREQRALHRVRELLLLLVEARVVDRQRGLSADRLRLLDRLLRHGCIGTEGQNRQRGEHLGRGCDRHGGSGPAASQERQQRRLRRADLLELPAGEHERLAEPEEPLHRVRTERFRVPQNRTDRVLDPRVDDVDRPRNKRFAAIVRHSDQCDVDVEDVGDRRRDRLERRLQRETLRERSRDLVERTQLPGRRAFRVERMLAFLAETFRLLVELRVLHGDRELRRERGQQRRLVLRQRAAAAREDREEPDRLVADEQRHGDRAFEARLGGGVAGGGEPRVPRHGVDRQDPAGPVRPE